MPQTTLAKVREVTRRKFEIKISGRSSDYITPSFGFGCLYNCHYCYCKRNRNDGLDIATNVGDILTSINNHAYFYADTPKPNQTHDSLYTYDISCNEDFALHHKYHDWRRIFDFFKEHPKAMATLATKTIPTQYLDYDPQGKVRIRFSLMPQHISSILEPNTAPIIDRIKAADAFIDAGYDVHFNFSPVVVYREWKEDYRELFEMVDNYVDYKDIVKAEVIFLTHNEKKHLDNLSNNLPGEDLLWVPKIQEAKTSQYGGENIRYKWQLKDKLIKEWTALHDEIIPWNKIRYIF